VVHTVSFIELNHYVLAKKTNKIWLQVLYIVRPFSVVIFKIFAQYTIAHIKTLREY